MTYPETDRHAHYVSVVDGPRYGLLLGPFPTRDAAEPHVDLVRRTAQAQNRDAIWYGFGTARIHLKPGQTPPEGRLNPILTPTVMPTERPTSSSSSAILGVAGERPAGGGTG